MMINHQPNNRNLVKIFTNSFIFTLGIFSAGLYGQTSKMDSLVSLVGTEGDDTSKVNHLTQLCTGYMDLRQDRTAIYHGSMAIGLGQSLLDAEKNPDIRKSLKRNIAFNHETIGRIYSNLSDFTEAMVHFKQAMEINIEIENNYGIARNLNAIGNVYYYQGDFVKTLQCFFRAYKINIGLGDKQAAGVNMNNIGNVYYEHGDYSIALDYFSKGLQIFLEVNYKTGIAAGLSNLADVYFKQHRMNKALEYYIRSLKIYEELDDKYGMGICQSGIADVYSEKGDYQKAFEHYEYALEINKSWGHKNGIALNLGEIADLFLKQKKYSEAETYLLKGLDLATEIGELPVMRDFNRSLSELYSQMNRYDLAYIYHVAFTNAKDSLFNNDKSKEIGKLEAKHEMEIVELERQRTADEELKRKNAATKRRHLLQYSGITLLLMVAALAVVFLGLARMSPSVSRAVSFFVLLLLFEFLLVLLDPSVERLSGGEPAYKLLLNVLIAVSIFPLHTFFERFIRKKLAR